MKTVVAFLARDHGLNGLQALIASPECRLLALATHRRLPRSEDVSRSERVEFAEYRRIAEQYAIPLITVDSSAEQVQLEEYLSRISFDLIASISWRRMIPSPVLKQAAIGGINLHRGKLPNYPGAEPIKQALLNGDQSISISAHILTDQLDAGEVLGEYVHPVSHKLDGLPLSGRIDQLKRELTPHFGPLLMQAIERMKIKN